MKPIVAIVGIPNVGKSTLFNRLVRGRMAIVTDLPGVTRDRQYGQVKIGLRPFQLVDTGGLTPHTAAPFAREIEDQANTAMNEAALILFVVDARTERTSLDEAVVEQLRRSRVPVLVVANKAESPRLETQLAELYGLGLGEPIPVSAEHGTGIAELLEAIDERLPEGTETETEADEEAGDLAKPLGLALVGRPNVGKSSIFNRLIGRERALVSEIPGTTRDAIDTVLELEGKSYRLIDTAGMRRRGRIRERVERFSVVRARHSIESADVCVLVIDASQPLAAQDTHIAGAILDADKPFLVAVNKWDLPDDREQTAKDWNERVRDRLRFAKEVPILLVSAKTGQRVDRILDTADELHKLDGIRVSTPDLNRWLEGIAQYERGATSTRQRVNLLYATQVGTHPATFVLFCSNPKKIHFSFRRHLVNSLREKFEFGSAPIRLFLRSRDGNR